ncbi:glycyl-radical enzyme activating protein [Marispirochaeta aestuarii]|uniref:glycyl-radical enzyme activating protein n=1 Tax=Marispirochaeta aestuarii TaxID=1963862 RepID=UPI002D1E3C39|nr:glycyl-radical enzyme activating protein [Marispirochaeta aestuarii]
MEAAGMVFDIQRFSLHDGPGIRTLVFLKGCPLSCLWCCNPESQAVYPQIGYDRQKCIACNLCLEACPFDAVSVDEQGQRRFAVKVCAECPDQPCADACPTGAIERFGRKMRVGEVVDRVSRDELFYRKSGGGVTLSGGEPLSQPEFSSAILRECKKLGYSTAVETCGYGRGEDLDRLAEVSDLFLFDIKHLDGEKHARFTGVDTGLILENFARLSDRHSKIIIRVPLIPGFNNDRHTLEGISDFARQNHISDIHLLPYHRLGRSKYDRLSMPYAIEDVPRLTDGEIEEARRIVEEKGVRVILGG